MEIIVSGGVVKLTEEQIDAYLTLTKLQRGFVVEILKGTNQTEAHRIAGGYAKKESTRPSLATRLLKDAKVSAFMQLFKGEQCKPLASAIMTREEIAERLTRIARTTLTDVVEVTTRKLFDEHGEEVQQGAWTLREPSDMRGAGVEMLSEFSVSKNGIKIKTHDQTAAMKQLADLYGWNKQVVEHQGEIVTRQKLSDFYDEE